MRFTPAVNGGTLSPLKGRKLVPSESGGFEKTRGEFVGTDPEHKLEFACDCGETFDNEEDATGHLRDVS